MFFNKTSPFYRHDFILWKDVHRYTFRIAVIHTTNFVWDSSHTITSTTFSRSLLFAILFCLAVNQMTSQPCFLAAWELSHVNRRVFGEKCHYILLVATKVYFFSTVDIIGNILREVLFDFMYTWSCSWFIHVRILSLTIHIREFDFLFYGFNGKSGRFFSESRTDSIADSFQKDVILTHSSCWSSLCCPRVQYLYKAKAGTETRFSGTGTGW